jgi:predicted PolB exonuclease-like 3'-5' exonuclease
MESFIRIRELGDMAPEIPAVQLVRNQNRLSSKTDVEILSSFPIKEMNTKVGGNFVPYNQDTEFSLFGFWTWEIWDRQGRATK